MATSVVIGGVTISQRAAYALRWNRSLNEAGGTKSLDVFIEVEGDVKPDPGQSIFDAVAELSELVSDNFTPQTVQIKEGSTVKYEFLPGQCVVGPIVTEFETPRADGNWGSRTRYRLVVYCQVLGGLFQRLSELDTSITVVEDLRGEVVRKVWKASAQGVSLQAAFQAVQGFKPRGVSVRGELTKHFQRKAADGVWIWEAHQSDSLLWVDETVSYEGGQQYLVDKQAGEDEPAVLHKARLDPFYIAVSGTIRGFSAKLEAPPPHFKEGPDIVRLTPLPSEATLLDKERGVFGLPFLEKYVVTRRTPPKPDHGIHKNFSFKTPPGDGGIAGTE